MTKRRNNLSQLSIFDLLTQEDHTSYPAAGSLDIQAEFCAAVSEDFRHAADEHGRELSRAEVAARMSDLAGAEITESTTYNWTARSHDRHRMPAEYLPAFVVATGGQRRAAEVMLRRAGLFVLPGPEALRAEIRKIEETIKHQQTEKRKREVLLKEVTK